MGAQRFNFSSEFSQNKGFLVLKFAFWTNIFPTKRYFDNFSTAENLG